MVTILADDARGVGTGLRDALKSLGAEVDNVSLEDVRVDPCYGCNGCVGKHYGKCMSRDDGDWIYGKILRGDALVVVTPILFGGYSARMKRVIDKFGLFMDPHYFLVNGEMTKGGLPGRTFRYFALGVMASADADEAAAFKALINETLLITRGAGRAHTGGADAKDWPLQAIAREVIGA